MKIRIRFAVAFAVTAGLLAAAVGASAFHAEEQEYHPIEREEFVEVWERTDRPVAELVEARTWIWGPGAFSPLLVEHYEEADDDGREVQYFDKSRMEMPVEGSDAAADSEDSPWVITQGLLAYELMSGQLQLGDTEFVPHHPSQRSAAGDPQDTTAPTYAAMGELMDRPPREGENVIIEHANRAGVVTEQSARFAGHGVSDVALGDWQDVEGIDHNIADVFWDFMTSDAIVYQNGQYVEANLFLNAFYAVGYPLTDAFWADVRVQGNVQDVLIQCFERRCLTFTPGNLDGWEVESGNIGQHYYHWRYHEIGDPITEFTIQLDPIDAQNPVGTEFTLTATLMEAGTAVAIGDEQDVSITVDRDDDDDIDVGETIALMGAGEATISYTGPGEAAIDTITVNIAHGDHDHTATTTKTWFVPEPELALAQDEVENVVDSSHEFTATLTENGDALDIDDAQDVTVSIERNGSPVDPLPTDLDVDVTGNVATISYTGPELVAVDVINVTVDVNGTAVVGSPELTKTWVAGDAVDLTLNVLDEELEEDWLGEFPMAYRVIEAQLVDEFGNDVEEEDVEVTFTRTSTTSTGGEGQFATIDPDTEEGTEFEADTGDNGVATAIYGVNAENPALPFNVTVEASIAGMVDGEETTFEMVGSSTVE